MMDQENIFGMFQDIFSLWNICLASFLLSRFEHQERPLTWDLNSNYNNVYVSVFWRKTSLALRETKYFLSENFPGSKVKTENSTANRKCFIKTPIRCIHQATWNSAYIKNLFSLFFSLKKNFPPFKMWIVGLRGWRDVRKVEVHTRAHGSGKLKRESLSCVETKSSSYAYIFHICVHIFFIWRRHIIYIY